MQAFDIGIIGGGPGGSTIASLLAKANFNVVLLEKERFPRFRIGESLLPCSMGIFKEIGFFDHLNSGKYIQKFGAQFTDYRSDDSVLFNFGENNIPSQSMAFEVPRGEFDSDLLEHAKALGVSVRQPEKVVEITEKSDGVLVQTDKEVYSVRYVVDASGRHAFLGHKWKMRQPNPDLINNIAVFSHYEGVKRATGKRAGDIIISVLPNKAWSWIIPFQGERTSVGFVTNTKYLNAQSDWASFMEKSITSSPLFADRMKEAQRCLEIQAISNYSHTCESMAGRRWLQVGDAAAFLDPIFSSGVHVSISSAKFAADILKAAFEKNHDLNAPKLGGFYESHLRKGVRRFHHLIRLFYHTDFIRDMKKILTLKHSRDAFTSAVAGDAWNDDNILFKMANI